MRVVVHTENSGIFSPHSNSYLRKVYLSDRSTREFTNCWFVFCLTNIKWFRLYFFGGAALVCDLRAGFLLLMIYFSNSDVE